MEQKREAIKLAFDDFNWKEIADIAVEKADKFMPDNGFDEYYAGDYSLKYEMIDETIDDFFERYYYVEIVGSNFFCDVFRKEIIDYIIKNL